MIYHGLTLKQKKFADEYIISGNKCEAAILAGYSEKYAKAQSHRLLENVGIKTYIDERLAKLDSEMRGEHTEQTLISRGAEWGQEKTNIDVGAKDRIKAAELLGKRYSMWTDKVDMSGNVELIFEDDYGEEDI